MVYNNEFSNLTFIELGRWLQVKSDSGEVLSECEALVGYINN